MDFDDVIKVIIPKSTRKKIKKRLKKQSLGGILQGLLRMVVGTLFGRQPSLPKAGTQTSMNNSKPSAANDPLLEAVDQAHAYRASFEAMAQAAEPGSIRQLRLEQLQQQVNEWTLALEQIVGRTLQQRQDSLLAAEKKRVPAAIKRLEKQLVETDNPTLRRKLERTLENRRKQLSQLEQTANNRRLAELKVENTLAQLGIIYTQVHSGNFAAQTNSYARLSAELENEVHALEDYLDTLAEIRQGGTAWN